MNSHTSIPNLIIAITAFSPRHGVLHHSRPFLLTLNQRIRIRPNSNTSPSMPLIIVAGIRHSWINAVQ